MDFINEKDIVFGQVGQQCGQVPRLFYRGAGRNADIDPHLIRDNVGKRGLAQAGRTVQQRMIQRFAAPLGRLNKHGKVFFGLGLPDVFRDAFGPQ